MKILIAALLVIGILFGGTVMAAEPEEESMTVTVEDITAVAEQIAEYDEEIIMLAKLIYSEARGVDSKAQQAAVAWTVLNRYDAGYEDTIKEVITARSQFAYRTHAPVKDEFVSLARDVMTRWLLEQQGIGNVGRVITKDYLYFAGNGTRNRFRKSYSGGGYWDWSLPDPYTKANEVEN